MKETDKLDTVREAIIQNPLRRKWRIKKREQVGYARYEILEVLYEACEPLTRSNVAFKLGKSYESITRNLKILVENNVVCDKLDHMDTNVYFTICPVCPLRNNCERTLDFWLKSGLLEPELPSKSEKETDSK